MKKLLIHFSFLFFVCKAVSQPTIEWQLALGGSEYDQGRCIQQTNDSGYLVLGNTSSFDGDVAGFHGLIDFWVAKLNANGLVDWKRTLGGSDDDSPYALCLCNDGGYVVAGYTRSTDGDVSGNHGDKDAWVVKLSNSGAIEWQKALGGSGSDEAWSIQVTSDGGYIVAGKTNSIDGDVMGTNGLADFWVVKLNANGNIQWEKTLGGSSGEVALSGHQTSDGGYIVTGYSQSIDGDISGNNGGIDFWVVKLDSLGGIEWQNSLGGSGWDVGSDIHETTDGYIACGYTGSSNTGDVTGHQGLFDYWIVKLTKNGDLLWQKTLGGSDSDYGRSMLRTSDGNYVIAGSAKSNDGDVEGNNGIQVVWVVKLNDSGELIWKKAMGGTQGDGAFSIGLTNDGGYIIGGYAWSNDGDVTGNHGSSDFWVVKLSPESVGTQTPSNELPGSLEIFPNPAGQSVSLKIPSEEQPVSVVISDPLGREISRQTIANGGSLDVSALARGMYLVAASTPSGKVYSGMLRKE